ncbi:hypothetical protein HGRIS_012440 [Hohenbuehelia grisea]|uniref:Uncharacterized protein n=1 Tax=Hohenbuehelia grisea TaxID=104357 RepID=A0ABR3ISC3_9AGAR
MFPKNHQQNAPIGSQPPRFALGRGDYPNRRSNPGPFMYQMPQHMAHAASGHPVPLVPPGLGPPVFPLAGYPSAAQNFLMRGRGLMRGTSTPRYLAPQLIAPVGHGAVPSQYPSIVASQASMTPAHWPTSNQVFNANQHPSAVSILRPQGPPPKLLPNAASHHLPHSTAATTQARALQGAHRRESAAHNSVVPASVTTDLASAAKISSSSEIKPPGTNDRNSGSATRPQDFAARELTDRSLPKTRSTNTDLVMSVAISNKIVPPTPAPSPEPLIRGTQRLAERMIGTSLTTALDMLEPVEATLDEDSERAPPGLPTSTPQELQSARYGVQNIEKAEDDKNSTTKAAVLSPRLDTRDSTGVSWADNLRRARQLVSDMHTQDLHTVVTKYCADAVESYTSPKPLIGALVLMLIHCISSSDKRSVKLIKVFCEQLCAQALKNFKDVWSQPEASPTPLERTSPSVYLTCKSVNISGFIGSLFFIGVLNASDMYRCIEGLLFDTWPVDRAITPRQSDPTSSRTPLTYERLCALHALFLQAGDKLIRRHVPGKDYLDALREYLQWLLNDGYKYLERCICAQYPRSPNGQLSDEGKERMVCAFILIQDVVKALEQGRPQNPSFITDFPPLSIEPAVQAASGSKSSGPTKEIDKANVQRKSKTDRDTTTLEVPSEPPVWEPTLLRTPSPHIKPLSKKALRKRNQSLSETTQ